MTLHDVPFYTNDQNGVQCMQVAMQCVLEYFLQKKFSLEELDTLTNRTDKHWTFTTQIVSVLYDLGLDVTYYSKTNIALMLEGKSFLRSQYGDQYEHILQYTDVDAMIHSVKKLSSYNLFTQKILTQEDFEYCLDQGSIPMALIDYNTLIQKPGIYHGHFVVITGYDEHSIYFHESGPKNAKAHTSVPKDIFLNAFNANGTDNDCVIVRGARKSL